MKGRIIKLISNDYTVLTQTGSFVCKARGNFRNQKITPKVGDLVEFDEQNNYILKVLPRKNELYRPPVSNIDQVLVVTSVKHPNFSTNLLDKLLTIIEFNNMKAVICFTKLDLLTEVERVKMDSYIAYYQKIGYEVCLNTQTDKITSLFENKITVFTGQSGAGKSTLLNRIDPTLNLETNEISLALGRGKHTTRHVELLPLLEGLVADTPGFSSLSFFDMSPFDIRDSFKDFNLYRDRCKYKDCLHHKEDDCYIKKMVAEGSILQERYENYIKFISELPEKKY